MVKPNKGNIKDVRTFYGMRIGLLFVSGAVIPAADGGRKSGKMREKVNDSTYHLLTIGHDGELRP